MFTNRSKALPGTELVGLKVFAVALAAATAAVPVEVYWVWAWVWVAKATAAATKERARIVKSTPNESKRQNATRKKTGTTAALGINILMFAPMLGDPRKC
jgi:hypothetical protein